MDLAHAKGEEEEQQQQELLSGGSEDGKGGGRKGALSVRQQAWTRQGLERRG